MRPAAATLRRWRADPVAFVRENFKVEPDDWQADFLRAFAVNQRLAMQACKGPGKSTGLSWAGWNFLATRPHPKVIATSVTEDNLRDGLWAEMSKWQGRCEWLKRAFTWHAERITSNEHPETWWMAARTWSKQADATQQAHSLAGIHADYVLFILDEAGGIPDAVAATAEGALSTGVETKLVIAGNPTHLSGPLFRAATREKDLWWRIEITGDPDDAKRSPRISIQWAREQIRKYGRDNPWVLINVFGKFPPGQANTVMGVEEVEQASLRTIGQAAYIYQPRVLGVDIARFGDDRTVFFPRQGRMAFQPRVMRNLDTMEVAGQVAHSIEKWKPHAVFVDDTGVGGGVTDRLNQLNYGPIVIPVVAAARAGDPVGYNNLRSEMWFACAEWVRAGGCLPQDDELLAELAAPLYKFAMKGQRAVESKDEMKKRGLASPDKADALVMTFAQPVALPDPHEAVHGGGGRNRIAEDWDPLKAWR